MLPSNLSPTKSLLRNQRAASLSFSHSQSSTELANSTSRFEFIRRSSQLSSSATQPKLKRSGFSIKRVIRGALRRTDFFRRSLKSYVDEYRLNGIQAGQALELTLRSNSQQFVPHLQVFEIGTDSVLEDVDVSQRVVRLSFTPEANSQYIVRVSSALPRRTGKYTLRGERVTTVGNAPGLPDLNTGSTPPANFSTLYGYGLVDAAAAVARSIGQSPFADVAFPDVAFNPAYNLDGSYFWGVDRVKAPEVWARGYTGVGVTVAVVDTGVNYNHPDLQNNIWTNSDEITGNRIDDDRNGFVDDVRGWDFAAGDNDPLDSSLNSSEVGHGTFIAGLIAGKIASEQTVAGRQLGVAPDVKIMPVRVLPSLSLSSNIDAVADGIRYAVNNGAKVINLSLGFGDGNAPTSFIDSAIESALQYARQAGVVVVAAAGNERTYPGTIRPSEPAFATSRDLAIAVGAINRSGQFADFSNPAGNQSLDYVVAPGVDIFSNSFNPFGSFQQHTYAVGDGTSFAAPYVAGIAALMLSANPTLTPAQVENILVQTANPQGVFA